MAFLQQELTATACALLCASIGSIHDVRERKIPNRLCGYSVLAGLALHLAFAGWRGLGGSALAGLLAGGLALVFWVAGGMGAGDVKLVAAIGCLTGFPPLRMVLISTVIAGGVFALALSLYHGRLRETLRNVSVLLAHHRREGLTPHPDLNVRGPRRLCIPFAVPVAAGCLFTLCMLVWGAQS
ncbi:MAG TPA: A24 family peptidase [Acidobacteriaceae bacterium]|nr:A24 family peptidase [Acidobacteriaceae bacterium]